MGGLLPKIFYGFSEEQLDVLLLGCMLGVEVDRSVHSRAEKIYCMTGLNSATSSSAETGRKHLSRSTEFFGSAR